MNILSGIAHLFVGIALVITSVFHPAVQKPKAIIHVPVTPTHAITITPTPILLPTNTLVPLKTYDCRSWGNGLRCDNGTIINNDNGQLRGAHNGIIYRSIGNQIDGSDGSICEPSGGGQFTCSQ